nr:MAG TPA: hypothetical protein [Caudoviricetes sp.]
MRVSTILKLMTSSASHSIIQLSATETVTILS